MYALVTGASSGIGLNIAKELSKKGYNLIIAARNEEKLVNLAKRLKTKTIIIPMDLSVKENSFKLYEICKDYDVEIVINNAGFGCYGDFNDTDIEKELKMIDLNITCLHILTKLFLKDFVKKDRGYILNVGSLASFCPGPLMSTYYATKNYVLRLTQAILKELKAKKSNIYVGVLCPGPVDTNFNNVADVKFSIKPLDADYVARYTVDEMFKGKNIIIPGSYQKAVPFLLRFVPDNLISDISYNIQNKKR